VGIPNPFAAFTDIAHLERIEVSLLELIEADAVFSAWAEAIVRLTSPTIWPDTPEPAIWIAGIGERFEPRLSGQGLAAADLALTFVYKEPRQCLSTAEGNETDATAKRIYARLMKLLNSECFDGNQWVPGLPLVAGIEEFGIIAYDAVDRAQPTNDEPEPEPDIAQYLTYGITYTYCIERSTFTATGFGP